MKIVPIGRRAASSIEKLSGEGKALVERMLAAGESYDAIAAELKGATGERVSRSSLSRWRRSQFEPARQRIEAAKSAAAEVAAVLRAANDAQLLDVQAEAATQAVFTILLRRFLELEDADITKVSREARLFAQARTAAKRAEHNEKRLDLERDRLEMERRELDQRMAEFEAKRAKAKQALGDLAAMKQLPPEAVEQIRAIYGLDD